MCVNELKFHLHACIKNRRCVEIVMNEIDPFALKTVCIIIKQIPLYHGSSFRFTYNISDFMQSLATFNRLQFGVANFVVKNYSS